MKRSDNKKISLIAVCGPTASGKSALAMHLCRTFGGELVSCDSMQIYRGMDIGTAKPTLAEREALSHHMIDICEPNEDFSVADFSARAALAIEDIANRGKLPVLCGGTGLYLDSVLHGVRFGALEKDDGFRNAMEDYAEKNGNEALHGLLSEKDPEAAAAIHPNNRKRVIRALEICHLSGMTKTQWDKEALSEEMPYRAVILALDYRDREALYRRIDRRVDEMLAAGLEAEARGLFETGLLSEGSTAGGAIGYKEFSDFFHGFGTLADAAERIKLATRHYAKRQLTWLRKSKDVCWLYPDDYEDISALYATAAEQIKNAEL